jgi:hypothetical protein
MAGGLAQPLCPLRAALFQGHIFLFYNQIIQSGWNWQ